MSCQPEYRLLVLEEALVARAPVEPGELADIDESGSQQIERKLAVEAGESVHDHRAASGVLAKRDETSHMMEYAMVTRYGVAPHG